MITEERYRVMKTTSLLINKNLSISIIVTAILMVTPINAQAFSPFFYLLGYSPMFKWVITQPNTGGIWGAVSPGYINRPDYGRVDAYNIGAMNSFSRLPVYNSPSGYPNIFANIGYLGIGGF
jgi:hypothetical protein